jgi:polar amino acid transport system substrate-binding protein
MKNFELFGLCTLILILLCPFDAKARQSPESIRVYTIEEFDNSGKVTPIDGDNLHLLEVIAKSIGLHFEVIRVPWKRAMENALHGDGILLGMSITKDRLKKFAFSDPININRNWLVTRCDKRFAFNSIADLKGKLIGVLLGTSSGEAFDQEQNKSFQIENDTGAGVARIQKLIRGRMDALVWYGSSNDVLAMEKHINHRFAGVSENNNDSKEVPVCVLPKPVSIVSNHFAMKLDMEKNALLKRINQAMAKARIEGFLPAIDNLHIDWEIQAI